MDDREYFETRDMSQVHPEDAAGLVLSAAAAGDLKTLVHLSSTGNNLFCCDYDARTALHLAASNGRADTVKYLLAQMEFSPLVQQAASIASYADLGTMELQQKTAILSAKLAIINATDRFKGTPLMDARREGHGDVVEILKASIADIKEQNLDLHDTLESMGVVRQTPRGGASVSFA